MSTKEEVRQRLSLAEIIGEQVRLTPVGPNRLRGLCPFHNEKTPSFYVDTERQIYHCFGCKASGDVFSFVQQTENLSFGDALRKLAERAGVQLEAKYGEKSSRDLYDVNAFALAYFREQLAGEAGEAARAYLEGRGVSAQSQEAFELGFAPERWDGLLQQGRLRGISEAQLLEAGLITEHPERQRLYDRFRGRIIFPIRDHLGRLVGFGGRALGEAQPKYLNTPETSIFKKGELLYGLDKARTAGGSAHGTTGNKRARELLVVEGYMDVIALHQHGFGNAVATLGTSLTAEHAALLERLGLQRLTLLFDRDEAGQKATLSGLDQVLGGRLRVRASRLPLLGGIKDPADLMQHVDGQRLLHEALKTGLDEARFRIQSVRERYGTDTNEGKRQILSALLPRMQNLDPLDEGAEHMRRMACEMLNIKPEALLEWINSKAKHKTLTDTHLRGMNATAGSSQEQHELLLLQQLLIQPRLLAQLDPQMHYQNAQVRKIMQVAHELSDFVEHPEHLQEAFAGQPEEKLIIRLLFESRETGTLSLAYKAAFEEKLEDYAAAAVEDIQVSLSLEQLRAEVERLKKSLSTCPPEQQLEVLAKIQELQRAIEAEKRTRRAT